MLPHAPGVQMSNIPEDSLNADDKAEADKENPDERISSKLYQRTLPGYILNKH